MKNHKEEKPDKPKKDRFINIPICIDPEPTIYTTGANLRPMSFVCDGRAKWMWVVVEFVDDSFRDGDVYNPPECAATKDELLTDTTQEEK